MRLLIANLLAVALGFTITSLYLEKDKAKQTEEKYELVVETLKRENAKTKETLYADLLDACKNKYKFVVSGEIIVCYTEKEK